MRVPAWEGDWRQRIKERLRERGFETTTAFVDSRPTASLLSLSRQLCQDMDVAAVQLQWVLIDEAEQSGTMERCARSLLVRELHEALPEGWHTTWDAAPGGSGRRLISACSGVYVAIPEPCRDAFDRVEEALWNAAIPEGWLPAGPDDPILLEAFKHWNEPE
jgi:hypothetical protein